MLKEIFNSILPDNIKDIPLIQDAVDIFVSNLEENSRLSIQIRDLYTSDNTIIKENLFKIYLNSLYTIIKTLQKDQTILKKLEENGRDTALIYNDIKDILNDEYFITSKTFKQTKGTRIGIEYAFNLARRLEGNTDTNEFDLIDVKPFHFRTEGNIFREMYENVVKPLAHPIGFTKVYHEVIRNSITDLFGFQYVYDVNTIEVRCLDGYFDVFTDASDDTAVKADFLTRINPLTGQLFTESEYSTYVTVYLNKVVQDFTILSESDGIGFQILFDDGTFLVQEPNPIRVYYRNYSDELLDNGVYIKEYTTHCSLFVEYDQNIEFTYTDDQVFNVNLSIGNIDDEGVAHPNSDVYYGVYDLLHCFKIGGNTYSYVEGTDEGAPEDTSTDTYVEYTIGELYDGTFAAPDTLVNGLYTEGNDYDLDISTILYEVSFINEGRIFYPTNSYENYIMTNIDDISDNLELTTISADGLAYFTTEEIGIGSIPWTIYNSLTTYSFGQYVQENGIYYAMINSATTVQGVSPASDVTNTYWKQYNFVDYNGFYIVMPDVNGYMAST